MWQNLVKTALIGTDKSTPSVFTLEKLKEMGIKTEDVAESILEGAGVLSLMRKGGFPLEDFKNEMPEPSEIEIEQFCSTQSARHLKEILTGRHGAALGEFAFYAKQYKKIIAAEFLPQILHFSRSNKEVWVLVRPIIGKRGEWLLKQNKDWAHLEKQTTTDTPTEFGQLSNEDTMKQAREIVDLLNNSRSIWSDDKKITDALRAFAYHANISLADNLNYFFSNELIQTGDSKISEVYKIFLFRKELVISLKS